MKRFLKGTILFVTLTLFLVGCSRKTTNITETTSKEPDVGFSGPSWKRDTTPITVKWFVAYDWYSKVFNPDKNLADKKLVTETGITLEISTGDTDKLNALILSGDLPDIITFDVVASQRVQMEDAGMVRNLDGLVTKYAPNINIPQSEKNWYRNKNGHWYSAISYFYAPEHCNKEFGGFLMTHNSNWVRKDLLSQTGYTLDDLKTKEGFFKVLKAVKDKKLQYKGFDVIPITGVYTPGQGTLFMAQQFGMQLENKSGDLLTSYKQPEYLEAIEYYNRMYRNGFFGSDEFTNDVNVRDQNVASGRVFAAQGWITVKSPRQSLYSSDPSALIEYAGIINGGDSGKPPYVSSINSGGWTTTMISSKSKHADRIITLFDYLSQDRTILDEEFGIGCYDITNGMVVRKPEKEKEYADNYRVAYNKYNMNLGYLVDYTINQKYENLNIDNALEKERIKFERSGVNIYDDKCFSDVEPIAGTDEAALAAQIKSYWDSVEPTMIMAPSKDECDAIYHTALSKIDNMGMKKLEAYRNKRFQENKKKLGLKYAWPSLHETDN